MLLFHFLFLHKPLKCLDKAILPISPKVVVQVNPPFTNTQRLPSIPIPSLLPVGGAGVHGSHQSGRVRLKGRNSLICVHPSALPMVQTHHVCHHHQPRFLYKICKGIHTQTEYGCHFYCLASCWAV